MYLVCHTYKITISLSMSVFTFHFYLWLASLLQDRATCLQRNNQFCMAYDDFNVSEICLYANFMQDNCNETMPTTDSKQKSRFISWLQSFVNFHLYYVKLAWVLFKFLNLVILWLCSTCTCLTVLIL